MGLIFSYEPFGAFTLDQKWGSKYVCNICPLAYKLHNRVFVTAFWDSNKCFLSVLCWFQCPGHLRLESPDIQHILTTVQIFQQIIQNLLCAMSHLHVRVDLLA